ncbi:hypothetical protein [Herpetosiphon giganteus]|uniref:hypothetical protein n=1 Tax=Herpetosiphon giganteus TaxID=2029754 RepID=UPI00195D7D4A|nr:hypothetical protein [Herpetosiphon giganteus]MBM7841818.1 hypothetical protein [Herpetosiphon giganteus]
MRWIWGCMLGLIVVLWPATPVAACSMIEPTLDSLTQQADLIVVATVSNIDGDQAFFTVDTPIKGSVTGEPLSVLNHIIGYDAGCKPELAEGNRFAEGSTWILFLNPNQLSASATWQTSNFYDNGALKVEQDQVRYREQSREQTQPLTDLVSTLTNYSLAGGPTATVLPVDQTAEPKVQPSINMPTATPEAVLPVTETTAEQASVLPWVLVGIGVLAGIGALIGWRRSR